MKKAVLTYHIIVITIVLIVGVVLSTMYQNPYLIIYLLFMYIGTLFSLVFLLLFQKKNKINIIISILILLLFLEINIIWLFLLPFAERGDSSYLHYLHRIFIEQEIFPIINWSILITKMVFIGYLIAQYKKLSKQGEESQTVE